MSARYLLVDGHSVIFALDELRALHREKTAAARESLVRSLQLLHDMGSWRVTVVFDGKYGSLPLHGVKDMIVRYAMADETADSIIERTVAGCGVANEILVVTADEGERITVESLGAMTASPGWLRAELDSTQGDLNRSLGQVRRHARW